MLKSNIYPMYLVTDVHLHSPSAIVFAIFDIWKKNFLLVSVNELYLLYNNYLLRKANPLTPLFLSASIHLLHLSLFRSFSASFSLFFLFNSSIRLKNTTHTHTHVHTPHIHINGYNWGSRLFWELIIGRPGGVVRVPSIMAILLNAKNNIIKYWYVCMCCRRTFNWFKRTHFLACFH